MFRKSISFPWLHQLSTSRRTIASAIWQLSPKYLTPITGQQQEYSLPQPPPHAFKSTIHFFFFFFHHPLLNSTWRFSSTELNSLFWGEVGGWGWIQGPVKFLVFVSFDCDPRTPSIPTSLAHAGSVLLLTPLRSTGAFPGMNASWVSVLPPSASEVHCVYPLTPGDAQIF